MRRDGEPVAVSWLGRLMAFGLRYLGGRATLLGVDASSARLRTLRSQRRPLVFYHWTEDEVPRLVLATLGVNLGGDVSFVVDDTLGGRLGAVVLGQCGLDVLPLRVSGVASAIRDTRSLMRHPKHLSISADGRGPYQVVNRRLPDLVRWRRALAVPVSVRAAGVLIRVERPWPLVVPGTRARIAVVVGEGIDPLRGDGQRALADGLEEAMSRAESLLGLVGS